jgi:hypothetical protein
MGKEPDVDISTTVRAKELRFGIVPEVKVWFDGEQEHESRSWSDRGDLPDEVEPAETYRNIEVSWSAASRIVHPTDPDQLGEESEESEGES